MGKPKVLIGVSIFDGMGYCLDRFLKGLRSLTYKNCDVLFVDNSRGDEFFKELKEKAGEFVVVKDDTAGEKPAERLVSSRNRVLDYALENGYDHVFALDADVAAPKNMIEELLKHKKDIVSGLYFGYFSSSGKLKALSVAWRAITEEEFNVIKKQVKFPDAVKSHEDLQRHLTPAEAESNELLEVLYPSAGCMLVSRKVFEKARYGLIEAPNKRLNAGGDDIYFIDKARKEGFKAYVDPKLKCDHFLEGKFKQDEKGRLIHPLNPDFYKAKS